MNFRPSAQLRALHDDMRCPEECPICSAIEQAQDTPQPETYWPVEGHYPEGWD